LGSRQPGECQHQDPLAHAKPASLHVGLGGEHCQKGLPGAGRSLYREQPSVR